MLIAQSGRIALGFQKAHALAPDYPRQFHHNIHLRIDLVEVWLRNLDLPMLFAVSYPLLYPPLLGQFVAGTIQPPQIQMLVNIFSPFLNGGKGWSRTIGVSLSRIYSPLQSPLCAPSQIQRTSCKGLLNYCPFVKDCLPVTKLPPSAYSPSDRPTVRYARRLFGSSTGTV